MSCLFSGGQYSILIVSQPLGLVGGKLESLFLRGTDFLSHGVKGIFGHGQVVEPVKVISVLNSIF